MNSFLFPILAGIASIGLYFFFISPNLDAITELQLKDEKFTASLQDFAEIQTVIARLESTYSGITTEDLQKLERFLPEEIDKTQLVSDISRLLFNEGIEAGAIALRNIPRDNSGSGNQLYVDRIGVEVQFFTNYDGFKKVLSSMENNLQIAKVKSVKIIPPGEESEEDNPLGLSQYDIELIFYSYNYIEE